jgi:hypothetical protein
VLSDAEQRLANARTAADIAAREKKFRDRLAATRDDDVSGLQQIADECRKVSCAVLSDAEQRFVKARTAADIAAREKKFRDRLAATRDDDVSGLQQIADECRKISCAVLIDAEQRFVKAQTAADTAAREKKFRTDLVNIANDDVAGLQRFVDECRNASCAVLNIAEQRLAVAKVAADTAAREQKFRDYLAATRTDDVSGLQWIVNECRKVLCAVQNLAEQRLTEAKAAADLAARKRKFSDGLAAAGYDITRLRGLEDECRKANCAELEEIGRHLADATLAIEAAAREQKFRKDLAATREDDVPGLKKIVDECRKVSCAVLYDASRLLEKARAAAAAGK